MMKTKKRLSAGMGLSADGIDPLFEFDVPRIFVDLTLPPRYLALTPHDPWFDLVHEHHSRPTDEFLAEQEAAQKTKATTDSATFHRTLQNHHQENDGEKENAATRTKRRNVAYRKPDAAPVSTHKATMRTVSASTASAKTATTKKPTKLPFGNSSGTSSTAPPPPNKQGTNASTMPRKRPAVERSTAASKARSVSHARANSADKDLQDLQALLAKHNKKFKSNHTYEPRQHSVRDVRMWEKHTQKSYYKLTLEDRLQANAEIAQLMRERDDGARA